MGEIFDKQDEKVDYDFDLFNVLNFFEKLDSHIHSDDEDAYDHYDCPYGDCDESDYECNSATVNDNYGG